MITNSLSQEKVIRCFHFYLMHGISPRVYDPPCPTTTFHRFSQCFQKQPSRDCVKSEQLKYGFFISCRGAEWVVNSWLAKMSISGLKLGKYLSILCSTKSHILVIWYIKKCLRKAYVLSQPRKSIELTNGIMIAEHNLLQTPIYYMFKLS